MTTTALGNCPFAAAVGRTGSRSRMGRLRRSPLMPIARMSRFKGSSSNGLITETGTPAAG
jgi:hypothetical protein